MKTGWMTRVRRALLMGLAWAAVWGPLAVVAGLVVDPDGSMDEMWVAIGAYPGFLSALASCAVLGMAAGGRGLHDLPLGRVAAWGALAGLLVGSIPVLIGDPASDTPVWMVAAGFVGATTLLSAASAVGSALWIRRASRRQRPATG